MNNAVGYTFVGTEWTREAAVIGSAAVFVPSVTSVKPLVHSVIIVLKHSLLRDQTSSHPDLLPGEIRTWMEGREQRLKLIRAVRGKYASVLTNSEEFAQRKRAELELER